MSKIGPPTVVKSDHPSSPTTEKVPCLVLALFCNDLVREVTPHLNIRTPKLGRDLATFSIDVPERCHQSTIIWPDNATAFEVFCDCANQWRYVTTFGAAPTHWALNVRH